jgi:hypothetical protein
MGDMSVLLAEYEALYQRWPTPDDMIAAARVGEEVEFATSEHIDLQWTVTLLDGRVILNAWARPVYALADLIMTAWWNTLGRDIPSPPAEPVEAMTQALRDLLSELGAHRSVRVDVDDQAADCVDVTFCLDDLPLPAGLSWDQFDDLLKPLTELEAASTTSSPLLRDDATAAAALQRNGLLVFRCETCRRVVSDRVPGWPHGVWVDTTEDGGATCGTAYSQNRTVALLPFPHTGRPVPALG